MMHHTLSDQTRASQQVNDVGKNKSELALIRLEPQRIEFSCASPINESG